MTTGTLRALSFLSLLAVFFATAFMAGPRPAEALTNCTVSAADLTFDAEEQDFLVRLNQYRAQNGAGPLTASVNLNRSAAWMANDLANRSSPPDHVDTLGRDPFVRMQQCDVPQNASLAENIAGGPSATGAEILEQWKQSPSHDSTMKNPIYKQIGIARDFGTANQFPWHWATNFSSIDDGTNMLGGPTPPPPPSSQPVTNVESPQNGAQNTSFWISGWAIDKGATQDAGVDQVHAYVYPANASGTPTGPQVFFSPTNFPQSRPDVAAGNGQQFVNSGFAVLTPQLPAGTYQVVIYAHSKISNSWNPIIRVVTISGPQPSPLMSVDSPASGNAPGSFPVNGWAIDRGATTNTGVDQVHVYVYPSDGAGNPAGAQVFFGGANYGGDRPDLGNAYGSNFRFSGFSINVPQLQAGNYVVRVYAHSTVNNAWQVMNRSINIPGPLMTIDSPVGNNTPSSFPVNGWAIDRSATTDAGVDQVHVYVYPSDSAGNITGAQVFFGGANVKRDRPDIAAAFGPQFRFSGYDIMVPQRPNGFYRVVVYMHSSISNTWSSLGRTISIGAGPVTGAVDTRASANGATPAPAAGSGSTAPAPPPQQPAVPAPPAPAATPGKSR